MPKKKIGLALGTGAARGMAHIGVLSVLQKEGIPIDMIAGTSIGAAIGALYAQGKDPSQIKKLVLDLRWMRLAPLADLTLPKTGLISGKKIENWFRSVIGREVQFGDLKIPFACVATDIMTGEEVTMTEGPVVEAVRASISIPGIFTVAKREGKYLVDGGLVNPVPVSVLRRMGAEFTIAVNVMPDISTQDRTHRREAEFSKEPHIFQILMQSFYIGAHLLTKSSLEDANIVIEPQVAHIGPVDFRRAQECIQQGELAAQDSIRELRRQLGT